MVSVCDGREQWTDDGSEIDDDLKRSSTVQGETVTKLQSLKADLARHIASLPAYDQRSCTLVCGTTCFRAWANKSRCSELHWVL